jgi:quercetin dioxygenase-like cupin family protein
MINPGDNSVPRLLTRRDMKVEWNAVDKSTLAGFTRGLFTPMTGTSYSGRLVLLPRGQGAPPHRNTAEHIIINLEGEAEFTFPDFTASERFIIGPRDILFIPADMTYIYSNIGDVDVVWFTVIGAKLDGGSATWPPVSTYVGD